MFKERTVTRDARFGGVECPHTRENRHCNMQACPTHCEIGEWQAFGACDKTCGSGTHTKYRTVVEGAFGGKVCPVDTVKHITASCNNEACPIDCELSGWSFWDRCSQSCTPEGSQTLGTHSRHRTITKQPQHGGKACGDVIETKDCAHVTCGIDATYSEWSEFGACDKTCGIGRKTMVRTVVTPARHGGVTSTNLTHSAECYDGGCPVDCVQSDWVEDPICRGPHILGNIGEKLNCGMGEKHRTRTIITGSDFGGTPCGPISEKMACDTGIICDVDCVLNPWGDWSTCTEGCRDGENGAIGQKQRLRTVQVEPVGGGKACAPTTQQIACNQHRCPVHCEVAAPSDHWTECTRSCGAGVMRNLHPVIRHASFGGDDTCASYTEVACNNQPCPIDCEASAWSAWSTCDKTCGSGWKTRTRTHVANTGLHGGTPCSEVDTTDLKFCNDQSCEVTADDYNLRDHLVGSSTNNDHFTAAPTQGAHQWVEDVPTVGHSVDGESIAATAAPTMAPTAYPDTVHYQDKCMNGPTEVDYGWHGAGYGDNWCNLCKCSRMHHTADDRLGLHHVGQGELHCQKKSCADRTNFGNVCSHTKCHFVYNFEAQHKVMMVSSHHAENQGSNHHCAYSAETNGCVCRCSGALSADHLKMQQSKVDGDSELRAANADPICLESQRRTEGSTIIRACLDKVTLESLPTTKSTW